MMSCHFASRLESENRAQKMRIDSSERESSVESDYGKQLRRAILKTF